MRSYTHMFQNTENSTKQPRIPFGVKGNKRQDEFAVELVFSRTPAILTDPFFVILNEHIEWVTGSVPANSMNFIGDGTSDLEDRRQSKHCKL